MTTDSIPGANKYSPSLLQLQQWMRWIVTDPRGVNGALDDPHPAPGTKSPIDRYLAPSPDCLAAIAGDKVAPAPARLGVYAEAYFLRIVDCMGRDFRRTRSLLGADGFAMLVAEYLKFFPSQSWNINEVGKDLVRFVSENPRLATKLVADVCAAAPLPDVTEHNAHVLLCELVRLEWLGLRAFFGPVPPPTEAVAVDADPATLFVHLSPGFVLLESFWPLSEWWQRQDWSAVSAVALNAGFFMERSGAKYFAIWRGPSDGTRLAQVSTIPFSATEAALARCFLAGLPLETALESLADMFASEDEVSALFANWTQLGIIAGVGPS